MIYDEELALTISLQLNISATFHHISLRLLQTPVDLQPLFPSLYSLAANPLEIYFSVNTIEMHSVNEICF